MEATANATTTPPLKPVVLYPTPGMGHLFAMVELNRTLAAWGLTVTVIIVDPPYDPGAPGRFLLVVSAANPSISFHRLPPVDLPPVASKHYEALIMEAVRISNPHLRVILTAVVPAPSVLVVDMFSGVVLDECSIPSYFFFTFGAPCLAFFLHLPILHARTTASFRYMGEELVSVPGVLPFPVMHAIHTTMERGDVAYDGFLAASAALLCCRGVIVNTFRSLEPRTIDAIITSHCTQLPGEPTRRSTASGC
ncbi:hypothetical protein SETIT_8G066200v2 [Setaria italica]|uniref:Uncharacterized protein n=1 Tax=Setaria italica TaxID=4555 RepID=A0A368S4X8_SETIT|nr:hypothetical protein SETIT_8G066200v2 [Setaria italica]